MKDAPFNIAEVCGAARKKGYLVKWEKSVLNRACISGSPGNWVAFNFNLKQLYETKDNVVVEWFNSYVGSSEFGIDSLEFKHHLHTLSALTRPERHLHLALYTNKDHVSDSEFMKKYAQDTGTLKRLNQRGLIVEEGPLLRACLD